jgi:hypothetical protein
LNEVPDIVFQRETVSNEAGIQTPIAVGSHHRGEMGGGIDEWMGTSKGGSGDEAG